MRGSMKYLILSIFLAAVCLGGTACNSNSEQAMKTSAFDPATATGRVFGSVMLDGKPPEVPPLRIGGDRLCQMSAAKIFAAESIVTGDGKLRDVIVYVRSGYEGKSYAPPETPAVLDQKDCVYTPRAITVMKGQKVSIRNSDPTLHTVRAKDGDRTEFNIAQPSQGKEDIQIFSQTAMPYRIGCEFHKWMAAYAGVFDHPFHVATGDAGRYELRLPPGKYEIVAWHQKVGEKASMVEVVDNDTVQLDFHFP
jgi:plastocyanin